MVCFASLIVAGEMSTWALSVSGSSCLLPVDQLRRMKVNNSTNTWKMRVRKKWQLGSKSTLSLDIHCICSSCLYYYRSYDGIGPCHDWFIFNKDVYFILVWTFQVWWTSRFLLKPVVAYGIGRCWVSWRYYLDSGVIDSSKPSQSKPLLLTEPVG